MSQPRALQVGEQLRAGAPRSRRCRRPSGRGGRSPRAPPPARRRPSARPSGAPRPGSRSSRAERVAVDAARRRSFVGQVVGVVAAEAELRRQHVVEAGVRGEHGHARRRRLVDDLVERALAHVVHEHVLLGEQGRDLPCTGRGSSIRTPSAAQPRALGPLLVGDEGPRSSSSTPASPAARAIVSSPFAGEVRPSATTRSALRRLALDAAEAVGVDTVADRDDLAGVERERAPVDADHRGRERARRATSVRLGFQCVNQRSSGTRRGRVSGAARMRVERDACARRPPAAAARARASRAPGSARPRAGPRARAEDVDAAVRRQHARRPRAVGEHDHLVDPRGERADLRHRGPEHRVVRVDDLRREDDAGVTGSRGRRARSADARGAAAPGSSDLPSTVNVRCVGR